MRRAKSLPVAIKEELRVPDGLCDRENSATSQGQIAAFAHHESIRLPTATGRAAQEPCIAGPRSNVPVSRRGCEEEQIFSRPRSEVPVSADRRTVAFG